MDNSLEGDEIRTQIHGLRREFKIDDDLTEPVPDYEDFKQRLEHLKYAGRLASQEPEATLKTSVIDTPGANDDESSVADPAAESSPNTSENTILAR